MKEILQGELIGLYAEVVDAKNKTNIGIKGEITDETKNMITIGGKNLIKSQVTLTIQLKGKKVQVDGDLLQGKPEERIKKTGRKK